MERFKKILVGVDLSWGDRMVADTLSGPNAEAVRQAIWLARRNSAKLDFFYSLELSAKAVELIAETSEDESTVVDEAKNRLAELVDQARGQDVEAESHVVIGKSWVELIRQVQRKKHDMVIVGTRHLGPLRGFFTGRTGIKLLRKCPCPVWVTDSRDGKDFDAILVAHDLRPVGDLAMELGCSLAQLHNAQLHVVHSAEFPEFDAMFPARVSAERKEKYLREAEEHIGSQLAGAGLQHRAIVNIVVEPPDAAIMDCIESNQIDLVVMGTVGRSGVSGFITGNTAEIILPQIPCSLLAVKPPGFESPV